MEDSILVKSVTKKDFLGVSKAVFHIDTSFLIMMSCTKKHGKSMSASTKAA